MAKAPGAVWASADEPCADAVRQCADLHGVCADSLGAILDGYRVHRAGFLQGHHEEDIAPDRMRSWLDKAASRWRTIKHKHGAGWADGSTLYMGATYQPAPRMALSDYLDATGPAADALRDAAARDHITSRERDALAGLALALGRVYALQRDARTARAIRWQRGRTVSLPGEPDPSLAAHLDALGEALELLDRATLPELVRNARGGDPYDAGLATLHAGLAAIWRRSGREPKAKWSQRASRYVGPFVRFVLDAAALLPEAERPYRNKGDLAAPAHAQRVADFLARKS